MPDACIPPALEYLWWQAGQEIKARTLLRRLALCSTLYFDCETCPLRDTCIGLWDYLVENEILNWKGVNRHVAGIV